MAKDREYMRLINCERWRTLRCQVLKEHPLCELCEREGYIRPATEVHHIVPVETAFSPAEKAALMYDRHNLMPLCRSCHLDLHRHMRKGTNKERAERRDRAVAEIIEHFYPPREDEDEEPPAGCLPSQGRQGGHFF